MAAARPYRDKIGSLRRVRRAVRTAQRSGQRVVFTNGCFDLLHPGHVRYLAAARAAGDVLVVGVNSDRSVRGLKGRGRPVQSEDARAEVLAALAAVDHVVIFDAPSPLALIEALQPDVLAKGADWAADEIVGADIVRARGGRVVRIRLVPGQSTTRLVERSRDGAPKSRRRRSQGEAPRVARTTGRGRRRDATAQPWAVRRRRPGRGSPRPS